MPVFRPIRASWETVANVPNEYRSYSNKSILCNKLPQRCDAASRLLSVSRVYESDALQVAAYLIVLRATAKDAAATFGYLRYATGTFRVGLTRELEERVRALVDAIRAGRSAATVNRSHSIVQRCVNCSVRAHCDEALG